MTRSLITTEEFAKRARAPVSTVRYWRHAGTGPTSIRLGRQVLYDEAEVDEWIDQHFADAAGSARS